VRAIHKLTVLSIFALNACLLFAETQFDQQSEELKETLMQSCLMALGHGGIYSDQTDIILNGRAIVGRGAGEHGFSQDLEVFTKKGVYLIKESGGCEKLPPKEFDPEGDGRFPKGEPNNLEQATIKKISAILTNKNLNGFDQKAVLEALDTCSKVSGPLGKVAQREKEQLLEDYSSPRKRDSKSSSPGRFNHGPK